MSAIENGAPPPTTGPGFSPALTRAIAVTTLGAFMAFLESTIVNVALDTLTHELHAGLATIQWVITAYLLAMAAAIPISGWAAHRFGAVQVYVAGLAVFALASLLCGLAGSVEVLIAARALQGLSGGLLVPIGTMITMRAARPEQMAKVMGVTGVPTIMAPVIGPTAGGLILDHAGWQWVFYLNVPFALLTILLAVRLLGWDARGQTGGLDFPGVALLTGGSVAVTYGLAEIGAEGELTGTTLWAVSTGAVLLAGFVFHQLRATKPLMDVRLFKDPMYAAASLTNFCLGAAVFGAVILMPLYFQIVRHEDAVTTGLLLIPQGVGVAVAMLAGAKLTDRIGSGRAALIGGVLGIAGSVPFTFLGDDTSYPLIGVMMVVRGFGVGLCAIPAVTAAYRAVSPPKIGDATVQLNVGQRLGGSAATAAFAVVLQSHLSSAATPAAQADAFGIAFWWVVGIAVGATLPALLLIATERRTPPPEPPQDDTKMEAEAL
ncbi:EmrB/QacA subfamily drug resistance transporter [Actinocorallia herbida]|uniref:EmrB/QacA subfamily drug resistance transporter n=1 Tax=Actinocorallia herbida TaxID=58109 RepID=A0A3N1D0N6_9ACTN|nr:MDR family MFS transporter [Actinocorallia herbida]ROO87081.1 EmrB/QacA subfamily drug resistance transporter [Actinocorallia herbida]